MALKAILETLDGVSDGLKSEYVEKDGKFFLSVEPVEGYELEDVTGLKNALAAERSVVAATTKELGKFGSTWDKDKKQWVHSLDPAKAKQALAKYDEFMALDPAKDAERIAAERIESTKQQLVAQHQTEIADKDSRISKLESGISHVLKMQTARAEVLAMKGEPELVIPYIDKMTRVVEKDNDFIVEVLDDKGNVRVGDAKGNPMTVKQLVAELRTSPVYSRAFEGDGTKGSGMLPNSGGGNPTLKRSLMSAEQKKAYVDEHGQAAFLKLPLK